MINGSSLGLRLSNATNLEARSAAPEQSLNKVPNLIDLGSVSFDLDQFRTYDGWFRFILLTHACRTWSIFDLRHSSKINLGPTSVRLNQSLAWPLQTNTSNHQHVARGSIPEAKLYESFTPTVRVLQAQLGWGKTSCLCDEPKEHPRQLYLTAQTKPIFSTWVWGESKEQIGRRHKGC